MLDVDLIFKVAGIGIVVTILYTVLKQAGKEEHSYLVALVGVVVVLTLVVRVVSDLFETVKTVFRL